MSLTVKNRIGGCNLLRYLSKTGRRGGGISVSSHYFSKRTEARKKGGKGRRAERGKFVLFAQRG